MTTKDAAHWRDKYLDLLDEQEAEQKQFNDRMEVLEKALLRVSLAAEGYDDLLDRQLTSLRDELRSNGSQDLEILFKPLEAQLIVTDEQRALSIEKSQSALQTMLIALRAAASDKQQREDLKAKAHQVTDQCKRLPGIASVLEEVAKLQQQVLDSVAGESAEFEEITEAQAVSNNQDKVEKLTEKPIFVPLEGQLQIRADLDHENGFSNISDKLFPILNDLLNQVEPPAECVAQKAVAVRQRLEKGLVLNELIPTLEDIRDLIIQAYLAADDLHKEYLIQVDTVLKQILSSFGLALGDFQEQQTAEKNFAQSVSDNMNSLSLAAQSAKDVSALKTHVDSHLQALQSAVETRKQHTESFETPLSEQLSQLSKQIQAIEFEANKTKTELEQQRQKALTDSLTQLPNREAYVERAHHEFTRWQRYKHPLTLAVTDIDLFKRVNDNYGHQAGDKVLQVLGKAIAKRLRDIDLIARYGGEEFVILLPETDEQGAFDVLDKIRKAVAEISFKFKNDPLTITLSIGLSQFRENDTVESVFARADKQLYVAKEKGRNLCLIAD